MCILLQKSESESLIPIHICKVDFTNVLLVQRNTILSRIKGARRAYWGTNWVIVLLDYDLQVSYGLSVLGANVAFTLSTIWNKNITDFTFVDWGTILANTGYSWGYGGLYLVDGQLGSPDPGCGVQVIDMI